MKLHSTHDVLLDEQLDFGCMTQSSNMFDISNTNSFNRLAQQGGLLSNRLDVQPVMDNGFASAKEVSECFVAKKERNSWDDHCLVFQVIIYWELSGLL